MSGSASSPPRSSEVSYPPPLSAVTVAAGVGNFSPTRGRSSSSGGGGGPAPRSPISPTIMTPTEGFEGVEKRLEINVKRNPAIISGARLLTKDFWDDLLTVLDAKILSVVTSGDLVAYILSESSLIVSKTTITFMTYGLTMLLNCLDPLLKGLTEKGLEIEWFQYSRKNFTYPWTHLTSSCSISVECSILRECIPEGHPYILGALDGDHYFIYLFDNVNRPTTTEMDQLLQLFLYDISETVLAQLNSEPLTSNASLNTLAVRESSGIQKIFCRFDQVHDVIFQQGYSANAIRDNIFLKVHMTTQGACPFASIETNEAVPSYEEMICTVLEIFQPKRFTAVFFVDESSKAGTCRQNVGAENIYPGFSLVNRTMNEFEPGYVTLQASYTKPRERGEKA